MAGDQIAAAPFLAGPIPRPERADHRTRRALRFVSTPSRAFLRQRLGIGGTVRDDDLGDALSIELDALERWSVGERLLDARYGGATATAAIAAEIAAR